MENLLRPVISPLENALGWVLDFLHDDLTLTYGWAIVVLTILVRIGLLPLWVRQYKSMRRLRVVQPQIKKLQQKYKGDRARQQEEMMKLYREKGINPFGSCLPILPQVPIFIALFYLLRNFEPVNPNADLSFMWVIDSITADVSSLGFGAVIIAVVYGTSQLISTELSAGPEQTQQIRWVFRLLPIAIVASLFFFDWPAGVVLYWASTNLWTAGQQLVFRQRLGMHIATAEERAELSDDDEGEDDDLGDKEDAEEHAPEPVAVAAVSRATPRRRRRSSNGGAEAAVAAGEPVAAPEPELAPEPDDAPESDIGLSDSETPEHGEDRDGEGALSDSDAPAQTGANRDSAAAGAARVPRRTRPAKKGQASKGGNRGAKAQGKARHGRRRSPRKRR